MTDLYLPPEQRVEILRDYARRYKLTSFVESGTAEGFTTWLLRDDFDIMHTIEIEPELWSRAVERFQDYPNVTCWIGDSSHILPVILSGLPERALIWLDGHWCGSGPNPDGDDTPIREELPIVLGSELAHVVLVDDARVFREGLDWEREQYDYPTLTWVREQAERNGYQYELAEDVIRLTPELE